MSRSDREKFVRLEVVVDDASLEAIGFDPEKHVKVRTGRRSNVIEATSETWKFERSGVAPGSPEWADELVRPDVVQFWQFGSTNGVAVTIPPEMSGATLQELREAASDAEE